MKWEDLTRKLYGDPGKKRTFKGASKASYGPAFPQGQFPMSSVPGEPRNGEGGTMSSVPGDAGAPVATESNEKAADPIPESDGKRRLRTMFESIIDQSPDADVISQISDLFKSFVANKDNSTVINRLSPAPLPPDSDDDAVSAAAATCEAALQTYRALTGHEYNR